MIDATALPASHFGTNQTLQKKTQKPHLSSKGALSRGNISDRSGGTHGAQIQIRLSQSEATVYKSLADVSGVRRYSRSWRLMVLPVNWELSEPLSSSVITEGSCMGKTTRVHQKKKKKTPQTFSFRTESLTLEVLLIQPWIALIHQET